MKSQVNGHPGLTVMRMNEKQWQATVVETARWHGWHVFHPYDMRRSEAGWPDLTLVREPRIIYAELKTDVGKVSKAQEKVLAMLAECSAEVYVWRPRDWPLVLSLLSRDGHPTAPGAGHLARV